MCNLLRFGNTSVRAQATCKSVTPTGAPCLFPKLHLLLSSFLQLYVEMNYFLTRHLKHADGAYIGPVII